VAQLILSALGQAAGETFGAIGAALGRVGGVVLGASIDQRLFGATRKSEGPRLTDLHIQGSTEGASIPAVYGRVRIAGQVIWAARFKEHRQTQSVGGGKGGPRVKSTTYTYSLSFAVGLCEGEIARIGRAWANGAAFDLSQVNYRVYTGRADQPVDPLIEGIEGEDNAPAFRDVAYIVFEDLPLENFGNGVPQLSFEIVRPAPARAGEVRLEEQVKAVCLIPGSGEFVYATAPVFRDLGPGQQTAENVHAERERANLLVSLDQLAADLPNCETVLLVVNWFGDDLRCGSCQIKPCVEIASKQTTPLAWSVGGTSRGSARVVSQYDGAPAYGGTPSDASVLQAIAEIKARGYKVGLYPMMLMDVPSGNALSDPYGAAEQAAYPWRGRVTLHPAAGQPGTPDKTGAAATQISAFVGAAAPGDFSVANDAPHYSGPSEWSYRRFILHYAKLAQIAGDVDYFIIGSELRGLTTARSGASAYPFVAALEALASDVSGMLGAKLTYAADWSEYFGHQPDDGSGDVFFHLDPLWADASIDAIGIDWYPPLTDWRDGHGHLDGALSANIYDLSYLQGRIEAGEDFDFFYASDADRTAQDRTAITDGAYDEPWIFRAKDVRNFWSRAHYDRPAGVRAGSPTAWVAESKPIWFIELGCPAIDKGSNAPHLFTDGKSSESAAPPFSGGGRDDLIQRRTLNAYLQYWAQDGAFNPVSSLTGAPMIEMISIWCWDVRPNPAFPARTDVWTDGASWRLGHWLNGRAGLSDLGDVVANLCLRAGVEDADASRLLGAVSGFVLDSPSVARDGIEALAAAYDFAAAEREGVMVFFPRGGGVIADIAFDQFSADGVSQTYATRSDAADKPIEARVRFLDPARNYLLADVSARRLERARGGVETLEAPLVLEVEAAEAMAQAVLADRRAANETLQIEVGPAQLALEPGDVVTLGAGDDAFEITRADDANTRRLELQRVRPQLPLQVRLPEQNPEQPLFAPTPLFAVLDLPPLPGAEDDDRPLAAVFASPWLGVHELDAGAVVDLETRRASVVQPAAIGELVWALWPGPVDRWDDGNRVRIKLYDGALASASEDAVLNGANVFAISGGDGEWEIVQARTCTLTGAGEYELAGLLRGRLGSGHAMQSPHPIGARVVVLDAALTRIDMQSHEWAEPLDFTVPPSGAFVTDPRAAQQTLTLPHAALRPWAPAHLRAARAASGDVRVSWVRCARVGGDAWGAGEPPLGAQTEAYLLEIVDGTGAVKRSVVVTAPAYLYSATDQTADFGALPGSLRLRVAQLDDRGATGLNTELTITL
jgi:hypothetical protein